MACGTLGPWVPAWENLANMSMNALKMTVSSSLNERVRGVADGPAYRGLFLIFLPGSPSALKAFG